jgi:hypothetical protein
VIEMMTVHSRLRHVMKTFLGSCSALAIQTLLKVCRLQCVPGRQVYQACVSIRCLLLGVFMMLVTLLNR